MVFDRVVSAPIQSFGNFCPLVAMQSVRQEQHPLLIRSPGIFLDPGVQVVVPSFSALLSDPSRQVVGDLSPLLRSMSSNQLKNQAVFFRRPWSLHQIWVEHLLPAVEALDVGAPIQSLGNFLPVLASVESDFSRELFVFLLGPVPLGHIDLRLLVLSCSSFVQMGILLMVPNDLLGDVVVVQHHFSVLLAFEVVLH